MAMRAGDLVLGSRYRLTGARVSFDDASESWIGVDDYDAPYLIKLWPYAGEAPDDLQRALWDSELRTMYRVGSSPGAEDTILVIRDAGVDRLTRCFVMVLEALGSAGYSTLGSAIQARSQYAWLSNRDLASRREMWLGLQRLAEGLSLLHDQRVLHRNVCVDAVFFNPQLGAPSIRLGGFEWSIRLGVPDDKAPPADWSSPPEFFQGTSFGYSTETDWYAFGLLAVRCLINVESFGSNPPGERFNHTLAQLERATRELSDLERAFLLRLVAHDPNDRLVRHDEILTTIKDIIAGLEQGTDPREDEKPLVVVINPMSASPLIERAYLFGFLPDPSAPEIAFNPHNLMHVANLMGFIQRDLAAAQLYAVPDRHFYILNGKNLVLMIYQYEPANHETDHTDRTWDIAFCPGLGEIRRSDGGSECVELPRGKVVVRTVRDINRDRTIRQDARSWKRYLPTIDRAGRLRSSLVRFLEFIRCTNQIELLIRDGEIFCYRIISRDVSEPGVDRIAIAETLRSRPVMQAFGKEGGMLEFIQREMESAKPDCNLVVLTEREQEALTVPPISRVDAWTVESVDLQSGVTRLVRRRSGMPNSMPAEEGNLRTWGMFGQVALIRRRKRAIDRLEKHSYLLRSLSAPGEVFMDTGPMDSLPHPLSLELVDGAKQAAITDVLRVRPIYVLQGPPGTGKTTLVAHLLRQILDDDPVAQILITAQAHGAVDVLRAKVANEAFVGVPDENQPLAVRLGFDEEESGNDEGSVLAVALKTLKSVLSRLKRVDSQGKVQREWNAVVEDMVGSLEEMRKSDGSSVQQSHESPSDIQEPAAWQLVLRQAMAERLLADRDTRRNTADFCELVKRGASLTYCTTSAGGLEELAESVQSFDWSIVEEAGKAHGFDLALPLQAGHRWLLIGDHKQLPPYRFKDYRDGIDRLDEVVEALETLPERGANLVDVDWIQAWKDRSKDEHETFKQYARLWLNSFERVYEYCRTATGEERRTIDDSVGAASGILSRQYRMHPTIGQLISEVYYDGVISNATEERPGVPLPRVVHPFVRPGGIEHKAIVWIDMPWAAGDPNMTEFGPASGHPRYTNPPEIHSLLGFLAALESSDSWLETSDPTKPLTLAVLSPYNQQVNLVNRLVREDMPLPVGVEVKRDLNARRRARNGGDRRLARTVDSFQGNEADIISVSLVRNNNLPPGEGLGFLSEAPRLNVLLSRAERLLILVGSWDFFQYQVSGVQIDDPFHPLWHWKKVLTMLDDWFKGGVALKIDGRSMLEAGQ